MRSAWTTKPLVLKGPVAIRRDKDPGADHARRSRAARGWAGMSAAQLGKSLGRNELYVLRRENGEYPYDPGDLRLIAEVTGVPLEFMLTGNDWTKLPLISRAKGGRRAPETDSAAARQQRRRGKRPPAGEDRPEEGTG